MRDWKTIAKSVGIDTDAAERSAAALDILEREFRPLAATLTQEIEPALGFAAGAAE